MIVVDASAWVALVVSPLSDRLADAFETSGHWAVPEHFRVECLHAIRGLWLKGALSSREYAELCDDLISLDVDVWPTAPLIPRAAQLAANATGYDAAYLALAEELGCALVTRDAKMSRVPGIRCRVIGFD